MRSCPPNRQSCATDSPCAMSWPKLKALGKLKYQVESKGFFQTGVGQKKCGHWVGALCREMGPAPTATWRVPAPAAVPRSGHQRLHDSLEGQPGHPTLRPHDCSEDVSTFSDTELTQVLRLNEGKMFCSSQPNAAARGSQGFTLPPYQECLCWHG